MSKFHTSPYIYGSAAQKIEYTTAPSRGSHISVTRGGVQSKRDAHYGLMYALVYMFAMLVEDFDFSKGGQQQHVVSDVSNTELLGVAAGVLVCISLIVFRFLLF